MSEPEITLEIAFWRSELRSMELDFKARAQPVVDRIVALEKMRTRMIVGPEFADAAEAVMRS